MGQTILMSRLWYQFQKKMHEGIHTGENPFQCQTCNATFSRKSNLKQHERIHTGVNPFQCQTCNATFSRKSCLVKHERIHTRECLFSVKPATVVSAESQVWYSTNKLIVLFEGRHYIYKLIRWKPDLTAWTQNGERAFKCSGKKTCLMAWKNYIRVALLHVEFILMVINFVIRYLVIIILLLLCRADSREPIVSIVG